MRISISSLRRAPVVAVVAACALLVVGSGSASAAVATFSPDTAGMKWQGAVTVSRSGVAPVVCSSMTTNNSSVNDSFAWVWNSFTTFAVHWNCAGGTQFSLGAQQQASWNGSAYRIDIQPAGTRSGPWGGYSQYAHIDLPWTNGSPSMIAFSSTPVGVDGLGRVLSVTGTINVTTASGGALALIH